MALARAGMRRQHIIRERCGLKGVRGGGCVGHNTIRGVKGQREGRNARNGLGWPRRCELAHAFLWEYIYKGLELVQFLGQLGVFLTQGGSARSQAAESGDGLEKIKGGELVWKNYTLAACSAHAMANAGTPA